MSQTAREPIQERSREKRENILKAALKHFSEFGYDGAKSREIAKDAGVFHPAIKYYFGDKDNLWRETVKWMFDRLNAEVMEPLHNQNFPNIKERMKAFIALYIRYCAHQPEHARIMIAETNRGGDRLRWMIEEFIGLGHEQTFKDYEEAMNAGVLPKTSKVNLLYSITGICWTPFVLSREAQILFGVDTCSEDMINKQIDTATKLLFR
jgi:AcrR family transcriptional regulator